VGAGEPAADLPAGCLHLGLLLSDWHARWPWSAARWAFVRARMAERTTLRWHGSAAAAAQALAAARSVHTRDDPHIGALLPANAQRRPEPRLFAEVTRPCASFSQWWTQVTREAHRLPDLPGLVAWLRENPGGPLFDVG
jgi:deoxyribodipyrimidine photo-lyase